MIAVIGCGRWGTFISWYLDRASNKVILYGREKSNNMQQLLKNRRNNVIELPNTIELTTDITEVREADIIVISINSQGLRNLMMELSKLELKNKTFVLCMKGIEIDSGNRLTEVVEEFIDNTCSVAVWLGPGHVQEFYSGKPNCMVIDSNNNEVKKYLVDLFSSDLIRFYYGKDLIGNEIGGASKNVIGIAAGMLDGLGLSSLKGALMSRGTREVARLIKAMGGNELSAYGLCHLGDYEATVFSKFSHNRRFGELIISNQHFDSLAEGYFTVKALMDLAERLQVDLPICEAVFNILYNDAEPKGELEKLFLRSIKNEF